MHGEELDENRK